HFSCRVSLSWACAPALDNAKTAAPARISNLFMCCSPLSLPLSTLLLAIGRVPEGQSPLDKGEDAVKHGSGKRRDRDRRPDHGDVNAADLDRNTKAHPNDRRAEELGNDAADQRQGRVDLECIEDEGESARQAELGQSLAVACSVGMHEIALDVARRSQPGQS